MALGFAPAFQQGVPTQTTNKTPGRAIAVAMALGFVPAFQQGVPNTHNINAYVTASWRCAIATRYSSRCTGRHHHPRGVFLFLKR
jgi:hypothetical protein